MSMDICVPEQLLGGLTADSAIYLTHQAGECIESPGMELVCAVQ